MRNLLNSLKKTFDHIQERKRRQELHCHVCGQYVQFTIDESLDGNHVLTCPCGHEHCRVVRNGKITDIRWDSRNGPTFLVSDTTITTSSTSALSSYITNSSTTIDTTGSAGRIFLHDAWSNRTDSGNTS